MKRESMGELLRKTSLPPTWIESLETREESPALRDLVSSQVEREARLQSALDGWLSSCQGASKHLESILERVAKDIEREILAELLG